MRWLLLALALLPSLTVARAGTELPISLKGDAEATIRVGTSFNFIHHNGYAAVDLKIENQSTEERTWRLETRAYVYVGHHADSVRSSAAFTVPAKAARTFRVLAPLGASAVSYGSPLEVRVSGPGTDERSVVHLPGINPSGKQLTALTAASESLATRYGSQLAEEFKATNQQLASATFAPAELPEDWRALVGYPAIWLMQSEVDQLAAGQRNALHDWVHRGGHLYIVGATATSYPLPEIGFGKVIMLPKPNLDVSATAAAILALKPVAATELGQDYTRANAMWEARRIVGELDVNVPLLIGFMAVFAGLSGPLNLFFFAPAGRRHRLFWTTPAISVAASIVLALLIVLQDGFGGSGHRVALVHLIPAERKQVVLQEQIARTGVLRSSEFTTADPVFIAPISLESNMAQRSSEFFNVDRYFEGWFSSRTLQAQWIECVTPSRAEIAVLNAAELNTEGTAPVILSSIDAPLDELYYFDARGDAWRGTNVRAGEKATLQRSSARPLLGDEAGPRLQAAWKNVWQKPGHFYASSKAAGPFVETLPSIRWEHQRAVYFGAASTGAPQP